MPASSGSDEPLFDPFRPAEEEPAEISDAEIIDLDEQERTGTLSSSQQAAGVSPLGIRHLLLWMACSAVFITLHRYILNRLHSDASEDRVTANDIINLVYSIWAGPPLVSLFVAAQCWRKRIRFPTQPGEWLLLIQGVMTLVFLVANSIRAFEILEINGDEIVLIISRFLCAGAFLVVGCTFKMTRVWRISFLLQGIYWLLASLPSVITLVEVNARFGFFNWYEVVMWFLFALYLLVMIPLFIAVGIDLGKKRHFTWLHWTGVVMIGANLLMRIATMIYFNFLS